MTYYLSHSAKGTSWRKKQADYNKKMGKRYYYDYEAAYKKAWRAKKKLEQSKAYQDAKEESKKKQTEKANARVSKAYQHVSDLTANTADITGSSKAKKQAEEYQRKANDLKLKRTKRIKLIDVTSDAINRGKMIFNKTLRKFKRK